MTSTTLAFPTPRRWGASTSYIQAVNRFPLLSAAQEVELGRRLRDHDDLEAARQLVLSHLRLVVSVSRNYLGYGLPQSDLIQEGNVGLMKAVRRFDPERGVRLVSFALHWIRAEIHEYVLRNWRLVKVATDQGTAQAVFQPAQHEGRAGLAYPQGGVEHRDGPWRQAGRSLRDGDPSLAGRTSRSTASPGEESETVTPIAYLTDADAEPSRLLERAETRRNRSDGLRHALAQLDSRSREIIEARWLREDDHATLQQLADQYGVSAERIRQIESRALKTMRSQMGAS